MLLLMRSGYPEPWDWDWSLVEQALTEAARDAAKP